jgi:SET domain-containing protein 6
LDAEDFEEYFIIERDSGEPDSEGRLTHVVQLREISQELDEQLRSFLKALKKSNPKAFADKRKRDEICNAAISVALTAKLGQYATSLEADEALLKKEDLTKRHKMALQVRLGEKKLLQEAIALVQEGIGATQELDGERATKKVKTQA